MPALRAVAGHKRHRCDRLADRAVVDQLAAGLQPAAQEGVGRAADAQPFLPRQSQGGGAVRPPRGERLLGVDMFPSGQAPTAHLGVDGRDGQVDHQVNVRIGQQLVHCRGADAVLGCLGLGAANVQVGARDQSQPRQFAAVGQVDPADVAAADDTDPSYACHAPAPFRPCSDSSSPPPPACRSRSGRAQRSATRSRRRPRPRSPARPGRRRPPRSSARP